MLATGNGDESITIGNWGDPLSRVSGELKLVALGRLVVDALARLGTDVDDDATERGVFIKSFALGRLKTDREAAGSTRLSSGGLNKGCGGVENAPACEG